MSTKALIGLIALIVVVGGGAWYFSSKDGVVGETNGVTTGTEDMGTASFADFIAQGGSRECTVVVNNPDAPASGVVFVSGDQVRSDFVAQPAMMNGASVNAHMIQTGGYVYSWTDMIPQGVKVKLDASAEAKAQAAGQGFDVNAQVEYSCKPWIVDASKFAVPSTVTFMEFSANPGKAN